MESLPPVTTQDGRIATDAELQAAVAAAERRLSPTEASQRRQRKLRRFLEDANIDDHLWGILVAALLRVAPDATLRTATETDILNLNPPTTCQDLQDQIREARPEWFSDFETTQAIPPRLFRHLLIIHGVAETESPTPEGAVWFRFNILYGDKTPNIRIQDWPLIRSMMADGSQTKTRRSVSMTKMTREEFDLLFTRHNGRYSLIKIGQLCGKDAEAVRNAWHYFKNHRDARVRRLVGQPTSIGNELFFDTASACEIGWKAYMSKPRGKAANRLK